MSDDKQIVLRAQNISRSFEAHEVLKGVSLTVAAGEIKALLGPNGAGKTTLSKICSGVLLPTGGSVSIDGADVMANMRRIRDVLSLVTGGDYGFYNRATARDNLLFFADLQGVPSSERVARVDEVLARVKLTADAAKKVGEFSRGMKQRLHLARGLVTKPRLIILDEITSGLDPDIARDIRALIREIANNGTAVLLTTHLLTEVKELADSVDLLYGGLIRFSGSVPDLIAATSITAVSEIELAEFSDAKREALEKLGLAKIESAPNAVGYKVTGYWYGEAATAEQLLQAVPAAAYAVTRPPTLEEAYLAMIAQLAEEANA